LPSSGDNPNVYYFQDYFTDLAIEIYLDESHVGTSANTCNATSNSESSTEMGNKCNEKKPIYVVMAHKIVVSMHSKYFFKMLTSAMREGTEKTIRLTTAYPNSLRKLLASFYTHVLEIGSDEELIEFFYLVDEYDVSNTKIALERLIRPNMIVYPPLEYYRDAKNVPICALIFTRENACQYLACSGRLGLNLEEKIFEALTRQWWLFGPLDGKERAYEEHNRNCSILLESLEAFSLSESTR
jgi:hypothetical protein